jgi:hypothetical protein
VPKSAAVGVNVFLTGLFVAEVGGAVSAAAAAAAAAAVVVGQPALPISGGGGPEGVAGGGAGLLFSLLDPFPFFPFIMNLVSHCGSPSAQILTF